MKHSLYGGYPFEGVKSLEVMPSRIETVLRDGKVGFIIDEKLFPEAKTDELDRRLSFAMDRTHDYKCALEIAEQQILDIYAALKGYPFIPEDFNFEETDIKINPDGYSPKLYKKGEFTIFNAGDQVWVLGKDTNVTRLDLENSHIAFITLRALGVITDEEFSVESKENESDIVKQNEDINYAVHDDFKTLKYMGDSLPESLDETENLFKNKP